MDNQTMIIIVIFVLALLFFGYTIINAGSSAGTKSSGYYQPQVLGGGCGR